MEKNAPYSDEFLTLMKTLIEELKEQSDRGASIVATAWLEESITATLESFLHYEPSSWQRLFVGSAPLANFSSKIDLCRLLDLITDTIRSDLHIIRGIRNEFAHQIAHKTQYTKLAFSTPHIKDKCLSLKCIAHEKPNNPRTAFIRACAFLCSDFETLKFFGLKTSNTGRVFARIEDAN